MNSQRKNSRGRKRNGDVLKQLEPGDSVLRKASKLAYGATADDPASEMVRTWRNLETESDRLQTQERRIGAERLKAAESMLDTEPGSNDCDQEALSYWRDKRALDAWSMREHRRIMVSASGALKLHNADWFRRVAIAIEETFTADGSDKYPLHSAVQLHLGRLQKETVRGIDYIRTDAPLDPTPRFTIEKACKILRDYGFGPKGSGSEEDWKRTVRRACSEVGVQLLPSKPGPKVKRDSK